MGYLNKKIVLIIFFGVCSFQQSNATQTSIYTEQTRVITNKDWLELKLSLLALHLSYPAYRIEFIVKDYHNIEFTFLASQALADYLTEKTKQSEAINEINYHALGLQNAVNTLLQNDFPDLFNVYDTMINFSGKFTRPGDNFEEGPKVFGRWVGGRFRWEY